MQEGEGLLNVPEYKINKASYCRQVQTTLYLLRDHPDDITELLGDQVAALEARLPQPADLLLDDGLESHVGGEEAHADA